MNARIRRRRTDEGAALILVLIIITVVSVVMAAIVANADTNIRSTVALRDQSSANYAADAAANAFLTQLTTPGPGQVPCEATAGTPKDFGDGTTGFYTPVSSQTGAINASVKCTPDTDPNDGAVTTTTTDTSGTGVGIGGDDNNLPAYGLLATQKNSATDGVRFEQSNKTICIENGSVASNSVVNINNNTLGVRLAGTGSATDCSTGSGAGLSVKAYGVNGVGGCLPAGTTGFKPTPCSALATPINTPAAPTPSDPITRVNQAAVCKKQGSTTYAAFRPGLYTNVALLNSPCSGGTDFAWFSPGTYYFDYGSTAWTWPTTLLGGTPTTGASTANPDGTVSTPAITSVDPTSANTLAGLASIAPFPTSPTQHPNSCADPSAQKQYPGVQFVFGGASTFTPNSGGNAELCGTYSATAPPIAIYGASNTVTVPGGSVTAETLCTPAGNPTTCPANTSLINATANGQAQFYIKGFVYAPTAPIVMNLKNSNGQIFNWGVIVFHFSLNVNGASPTAPFIQLPSPNQGFTQTTTTTTTYKYRYVNVWTCPKSGTNCPQTGPPDVRVKIQYSGSGAAKILSWSHRR